ncbi:hypothetical protein B0H19DRAFT_113606 [Mycena capillaripes]|nr:hypothetical protein B0H19DRAFT_113606 [Mycena capillaripes]
MVAFGVTEVLGNEKDPAAVHVKVKFHTEFKSPSVDSTAPGAALPPYSPRPSLDGCLDTLHAQQETKMLNGHPKATSAAMLAPSATIRRCSSTTSLRKAELETHTDLEYQVRIPWSRL